MFEPFQLSYVKYFDLMRFKNEIVDMISTTDFHLKSINSIKQLIVKDELKDVLVEVFDLIQLICSTYSFYERVG